MHNKDQITKEAVIEPTRIHMLSNEERLRYDIAPKERLALMDEDTYEELVAVWAYACLKSKYKDVYRIGGAGDKGRDICAYIDLSQDKYDLYQCKHYKNALTYSDINIEFGKLIYYSFIKAISVPSKYYFMAPLGISPSLLDLIKDKGKLLKNKLKSDWNTKIHNKIIEKQSILLAGELLDYFDNFNFEIIDCISPDCFIDDLKKEGHYYFFYFGGGINSLPSYNILVPNNVAVNEVAYIKHLLDAYTEDSSYDITIKNITGSTYDKHFSRSRESFYKAESVAMISKEISPATDDEFEKLKNDVLNHVGDTYDEDYNSGYERVKAVTKEASHFQVKQNLLAPKIGSNELRGVCFQLSNEDKLIWKIKQ